MQAGRFKVLENGLEMRFYVRSAALAYVGNRNNVKVWDARTGNILVDRLSSMSESFKRFVSEQHRKHMEDIYSNPFFKTKASSPRKSRKGSKRK